LKANDETILLNRTTLGNPYKIAIKKGKGKTSYEEHISDIYLSFMSKGNLILDVPTFNEIHDGLLEKMNLMSVAEKWQQKIKTFVFRSSTTK